MFKKWREKRKAARFNRGYDLAAGRLLREGKKAKDSLECDVETSEAFNAFDEFDAGVLKAIADWKAQHIGFTGLKDDEGYYVRATLDNWG